jgi:hypothetical protein
MKRVKWSASEWAEANVRLWDRANDHCEFCGDTLIRSPSAVERHHRQAKKHGGPDADHNIALVHQTCHQWAHANPLAARELGWIVPSWGDPATTPITKGKPWTR